MNEAQIIIQIVSEYYNIPIDVLKTGKRKIENIKAIFRLPVIRTSIGIL